MLFDKDEITELAQYFTLQNLTIEFAEAMDYQDKGHFVLDSSGGGFGALVLPMQDILHALNEAGLDIADNETFEQIGTDMATFSFALDREREAAQSDDRGRALLRPAP